MPLIHSPRLTAEDVELWQDYESGDMASGGSLPRRTAAAVDAIRKFASAGPCYCGVSWGKDSVVVAYLCRLAECSIPLIHLRPSNHNPDCDAVRDAYFDRWPGQAYSEVPIDYAGLHGSGLPHQQLDKDTDRLWYAAIRDSGRPYGHRHIIGIRSEESTGRKIREAVFGVSSENGCAPITRWRTSEVFAFLAIHGLPVHPAYAMSGGGMWPRDRLRVAEIGDTHGTGSGRREWEREYYGDCLAKLAAGKVF